MIDSLAEDEQEGDYLKDGNFVSKEVKAKVEELLADIETDEILALQQYLSLSKKKDKIDLICCMTWPNTPTTLETIWKTRMPLMLRTRLL